MDFVIATLVIAQLVWLLGRIERFIKREFADWFVPVVSIAASLGLAYYMMFDMWWLVGIAMAAVADAWQKLMFLLYAAGDALVMWVSSTAGKTRRSIR